MGSNMSTPPISMSTEQIEVFADGLCFVATLDGVHEHETELIRQFLSEAGHSDYLNRLNSANFSLERAARVLDTSYLRRLFLKASIALTVADHQLTTAELDALGFLARAFDIADDLESLIDEVTAGPGIETSG